MGLKRLEPGAAGTPEVALMGGIGGNGFAVINLPSKKSSVHRLGKRPRRCRRLACRLEEATSRPVHLKTFKNIPESALGMALGCLHHSHTITGCLPTVPSAFAPMRAR